jgi:HlyD family secretion protein
MKKFIAVLIVLSVVLGSALAYKLYLDKQALKMPPGSSGVVEGTTTLISARIGARIDSIEVREGDSVKAGDVLVKLDCSELDSVVEGAKSQVAMSRARVAQATASAEAALYREKAAFAQASSSRVNLGTIKLNSENADRQKDRAVKLNKQEVMPLNSLENYETTAAGLDVSLKAADVAVKAAVMNAKSADLQEDAAKGAIQEAEGGLAAAEAGLRRAEINQKECVLTAPSDGVVTIRSKEPGETVLPGSTLLEITDSRVVKINFFVRTAEVAVVTSGMAVRVVADAIADQVFDGKIVKVSQNAEFTPRNIQTRSDRDRLVFEVEAAVDNVDGRLKPGMPVEVQVVDAGAPR